MRIRNTYYFVYRHWDSEKKEYNVSIAEGTENFCNDLINGWIQLPHWKKCVIKWHSNIAISLCKNLLRFASYICSFSYRFGVESARGEYNNKKNYKILAQEFYLLNEIRIRRVLPISLTIEDIIQSLYNQYKEEAGIDITFSKELQKSLKINERDQIVQHKRQSLKSQHEYFLDIAEKLKNKYKLCH